MIKNLPANVGDARDAGLTPGAGRSPGAGNVNPLQYYLENSKDSRAFWATVHGSAKSWTQLRIHKHTQNFNMYTNHNFCITPFQKGIFSH